MSGSSPRTVALDLPDVILSGDLSLPAASVARALIIFVHGRGSSRLSPRNRQVAARLVRRGFATLLFDLLSADEDRDEGARFDIPRLTRRLVAVTEWVSRQTALAALPIGYFGASTGAAAALIAATVPNSRVRAVVSRGGRPDLAFDKLTQVGVPTLLIVGGADDAVIELNRQAYAALASVKRLAIVPGATHLFEEPGTLDEVARLAGDWFECHCR